MAKGMNLCALVLCILFVFSLLLLYFMPSSLLLSFCITLGVFSYHLVMRLLVGLTINAIFHNRFNYNAYWFREKKGEKRIYNALRVRKWASKIPTYSPDTFCCKKHSWDEIAMATCQAEIVHEIIILLSLLPMLLIIPFGSAVVFIITSILSALFDSAFVIAQRYNRPKLIKHIERRKRLNLNK